VLVFVDESGDPGMKGKKGSSALFVVAAIIFFENTDANVCDDAIAALKPSCFKKKETEFKFNKCCRELRRRFFVHVEDADYLYVAFVFNKAKMYGPGFQYKSPFYKYACKLLFESAKPYLQQASVTIDGSGDRVFRKQLQTYLKAKINTDKETIKRVKMEASHSNNLLQLADMVCGAVARSYKREKANCGEFRQLIKGHELGVTVWPKR
jgi:hypothetical protein